MVPHSPQATVWLMGASSQKADASIGCLVITTLLASAHLDTQAAGPGPG